jgi:hypothetical protein
MNSSWIKFARAVLFAFVLLAPLVGCGTREPFELVRASGRVRYEDGTLIPVKNLTINFHPQAAAKNNKTYPRTGSALIDSATGAFSSVTSHRHADGIVKGKHKVTLHLPGRMPLPPEIASDIYSNHDRTPLEVDTGKSPFDLRVAKPTKRSSGSNYRE